MIQFETKDQDLIVHFNGRLDTQNTQTIEKDLLEQVRAHTGDCFFDLAKVDYIASAFLRVCIIVMKDIGAKHFSIINAQSSVKRIFKIAGIDHLLQVS